MIQLKVGGKTHEIVEEQAVGNSKTGLSPLPYRGFSKPDTNWLCCVKAAYMVLHDTLYGFTPVSKRLLLVKTEWRTGRLYFEVWYLATRVNCSVNHRTYHSSKHARTWLMVFHLASWLLHPGAKEREETKFISPLHFCTTAAFRIPRYKGGCHCRVLCQLWVSPFTLSSVWSRLRLWDVQIIKKTKCSVQQTYFTFWFACVCLCKYIEIFQEFCNSEV